MTCDPCFSLETLLIGCGIAYMVGVVSLAVLAAVLGGMNRG